jgi:uncharacterized coiled-coil protein SlyX
LALDKLLRDAYRRFVHEAADAPEQTTPEERIAALEAQLAERDARLAEATRTIARLRDQYTRALEKLVLMQRRLFITSSERRLETSTDPLELELRVAEVAALKKELEAAEGALGGGAASTDAPSKPSAPMPGTKKPDGRKKRTTPPTGRRGEELTNLPRREVPIVDEELEAKGLRIGTVESFKLGHERGGPRCLVIQLAVYKKPQEAPAHDVSPEAPRARRASRDATTEPSAGVDTRRVVIFRSAEQGPEAGDCAAPPSRGSASSTTSQASSKVTPPAPIACNCAGAEGAIAPVCPAPSPKLAKTLGPRVCFVRAPRPLEIVRRGMLAPSMIAHVLAQKYLMGLPFHRLEQQFEREGFALDRGTMGRYGEEIGAVLGFIVEAARNEAIASAFCLSTDATGASIQPEPLGDGRHQPCRKGHFFVTLADRDHVFFDFQPKHNSLAVWEMFKGFKGYIQADAHVIYDALFLGIPPEGAGETAEEAAKRGPPPIEVGCWSHARRHLWEAAVCRYAVGIEGMKRISALFDADRPLQELPPQKRKLRRDQLLRPLVDEFFTWAKSEQAKLTGRSPIASALGYVLNQEIALRRFLEDGRLRLENNGAERALRTIAVARKAWLFFGSDDHASAAANLFSLIASCKLHGLDPEAYLADVIRVFPYWPSDRLLELAPKYWARTRARLEPRELELPLGRISVPPPLAAEEQRASG